MPKVTYLKEFEGKLWARLEFDGPPNTTIHMFTVAELRELEAKLRKDVWDEIHRATDKWDDE